MELFDSRKASPMLIAEQTEAFDHPDWIFELKLDGFQCLAYMDRDMADFRNKRNMRMLPKFPELAQLYQNVKGRCILDGEIVVLVNGVPDFYRLQKRTLFTDRSRIELEERRFPASFVVFDCIALGNGDLVWESLMLRKEKLSGLIVENERLAVSRYVEREGKKLYQAADMRKLEGIVTKRKDSFYYMGKRTKDWIKCKRISDADFIVAGYIPKGRHIFSFILAQYRNDILVYKGHVTSGVTKEAAERLTVTGKNPFVLLPLGNEAAIWVEPDHVCVVEYMPNLMDALRQPIFKGFRDDVLPKEVQAE